MPAGVATKHLDLNGGGQKGGVKKRKLCSLYAAASGSQMRSQVRAPMAKYEPPLPSLSPHLVNSLVGPRVPQLSRAVPGDQQQRDAALAGLWESTKVGRGNGGQSVQLANLHPCMAGLLVLNCSNACSNAAHTLLIQT